ncbi:MAG: MFS transporter, partial [Chloroflexi bacterium]|nr:MFS transporter [Chloroflexota bacterium]
MPLTETPRKPGLFYGWFALVGLMLIVFCVGGIFGNSFGVFLPVVSVDMGWTRGSMALALSLGITAFGLPSPLFGILTPRVGERNMLVWGNLLAGLGIMGLSLVHRLWQLDVLYTVIGFGAGVGGFIPGASLVANWFVKKRSLALGLFTACGGLGGFTFPPVATALIEAIGWRLAWLALGGLIIAVAVVLGGIVLIRNKPADKGLYSDGDPAPSPQARIEAAEPATPAVVRSSFRMSALLRHPVVWLIGGFAFCNAFAMGTMMSQQVAYLLDRGWTPISAAATISLLFGMSFAGSVTFGMLALKLKIRYLALAGFTLQFLAINVLIFSHAVPFIYVFALMMGLGGGTLTTAMPTFVGLHFHGGAYAKAIGIVLPFQVVSQSIASVVAGSIYDATGGYTIAFYLVAAFTVVGFLLVAAGAPSATPGPPVTEGTRSVMFVGDNHDGTITLVDA